MPVTENRKDFLVFQTVIPVPSLQLDSASIWNNEIESNNIETLQNGANNSAKQLKLVLGNGFVGQKNEFSIRSITSDRAHIDRTLCLRRKVSTTSTLLSLRLLVTQAVLRIWKPKITSAGKVRPLSQAFITSAVRPYGVWENACHRNTCDLTRDDCNCALHFTAGRHADVIDSLRELFPLSCLLQGVVAYNFPANRSVVIAPLIGRQTGYCR